MTYELYSTLNNCNNNLIINCFINFLSKLSIFEIYSILTNLTQDRLTYYNNKISLIFFYLQDLNSKYYFEKE